jgi:hypothetical protein
MDDNGFSTGLALGQNGGFGGNSGEWIFGLIVLLALFNGNFGGNNREGGGMPFIPYQQNSLSEADLCNSMNFNNLENAVGRISDTQQTQFTQLNNGLCQIGYQNLQNTSNLQQQLSECCCTTQRAIDNVNYNSALNTASINANTTEQVQKVLDAICGNRIADMQNQINQLQLQSSLCGVVRYPNATTYTAGVNPFFNSGCAC